MAASAAVAPSLLHRTLSFHGRTDTSMPTDAVVAPSSLHRTLSCPSAFSYLDPPPVSPAEAVYRFAHGEVGDDDADLYEQLHSLERELDRLDQLEQRVRLEAGELRRQVRSPEDALKDEKGGTPLVVGHVVELVVEDHAVVEEAADDGRSCGYYVRVGSTVDRGRLKPSATVLLHVSASRAVLEVVPACAGAAAASLLLADGESPGVTYDDVAGCEAQKRALRDAVELPLTRPELFARLGVDPPRGVLLCGPPGTGKTMLARAVAHHTSAAFFRVSGAALVAKFLGEGPRIVRDVFRLAREKAPSIVFIDEVDAVATARPSDGAADSGGDREVQRVLVELLAHMDGFDGDGVRVIMATNRADELDPALLRPGRLDCRIEFPLPDRRQKLLMFRACAAGMSLDGDVDLESLAARHDGMSPAEIAVVCFEAGMRAVRGDRSAVTHQDFEEGYRAVAKRPEYGPSGP
ncbi:hypothetical protein C2845_PM03G27360 [Panicum miliaceum]|uniref:AAA+ ATPase domain-containing protein n=1 Tax=Panicum miliaceum TaxID=4540 RepID=A0A3L6TDT7_PANMI|nr:hypothetical protein C2845_PM03G27360 [Panicum miliaceum]